jgi:hypothetical protein
MSGLKEVRDDGKGAYVARIHRIEPHTSHGEITIPKEGRPGGALVDAICWHLDQDVRRYELDHEDADDPWHRLPSGPLLFDPMLRTAMEDAGMDELALCRRLVDADGFGAKRKVTIRLGGAAGIWPEVNIRMNEVHARFALPGGGATWSRGHLTVAMAEIPETVATAACGRPLCELVDHGMIRRSGGLTVTAVTRGKDGTYTIATDAARPDGMVKAPERAIAAHAA